MIVSNTRQSLTAAMAQRNNGEPSKAGGSQTEFVMLNLFQYNFLSMRVILKRVQHDDNGPAFAEKRVQDERDWLISPSPTSPLRRNPPTNSRPHP